MSKVDNKELEEAIKFMKNWLDYEKNNKSIMINADELLEMETIVLNELLRLQEENKDLKKANREKANKLIQITDLYMNSISKDKIKEKIEELYKLGDYRTETNPNGRVHFLKEDIDCQIEILQELLGDDNNLKELGLKLVLLEEYIEKDKIKEIIENEKINISGLEVITVEDLEELLEGK